MQQQKVVSWLSQHNFPHGLVSFADGLSTDPLRHKTTYLQALQEVNFVKILLIVLKYLSNYKYTHAFNIL